MLVSIIIVNYNTFITTCNCIESVLKYTVGVAYELILVDNASTKDNADEFLMRFPNINLIKSEVNGGFAKGNNLGIEFAKGDIILLLNSDTLLTEDSISFAAKHLSASKNKFGAITTHLTYNDGKYQHNARAFRSIRNELLDLCRPLLRLIPYRKRAGIMLNQYFKGDFDIQCDWVSGAFFMFHKSLLILFPSQKLDERFFMYGEDHLWCYQFQSLGYPSYFLSATKVIHIANVSADPGKQYQLLKTMLNKELAIMRYRRGKSLYYYIFLIVFSTKEYARYGLKVLLAKLFNFHVR